MAKVIHLRVENILGLAKAEASPNGRSVAIGGENGQGKSSLQQALKMILGGKDFVPAEPVKRGAEKGTGHLDLDNGYSIDFAVTPDRKTKLKIRHRDNPGFASDSVTLLKSLFGELSFDPGEWMAKDLQGKLETLRKLTGLDFAELNQKRDEAYRERTDAGKEAKKLEGQLSGLPFHVGVPEAEESMADLVRAIDAARSEIAQHDQIKTTLDARIAKVRQLKADIEDIDADIKRLQESIKRLEEKREKLDAQKTTEVAEARALKAQMEAFTPPDYEGLLVKQAGIEGTNRKVRENEKHLAVKAAVVEAKTQVERLTSEIEAIDAQKRELLASARLPIDGLTFDDDAIRFGESPWEQCSESEQWDVATAISFALNPQGVVFMSKSGGMSRKSRARVMERAAGEGVQLFMEVVIA